MDRYGLALARAYGILDNLDLGISVAGAVTDAEFRQDIALYKLGLDNWRAGVVEGY